MLAHPFRDLRFTVRLLRHNWMFVATALVSMSLAVGATISGFSLLNALLLRELPVADPSRLVNVFVVDHSGGESGLSFPAFRELQRAQQVFSSLAGWTDAGSRNLGTDQGLVRGETLAVSANFYSTLGVTPAAGRLFRPADSDPSSALVAVLGYTFWHRALAGDQSVVGRVIRVEDTAFTVIGIAPHEFKGLGVLTEPDVTILLRALPVAFSATGLLENRRAGWVNVVGRLQPHISLEQARATLKVQWPHIRTATAPPDYSDIERLKLSAAELSVASAARGIEPHLRSQFKRPLFIVLGMSFLMLLLAGVNVAGLILARSTSRIAELTLRIALGATRWQITRLVFVEGSLLAFLATCAGAVLGYWTSRVLQRLMLEGYAASAALDTRPDLRVVTFTVLVMVISAGLLSTAPTWFVTRLDVAASGTQSRTASGTGRMGKLLVVVQLAISVVLLTHAGLLLRTVLKLSAVNPGYTRKNILIARLAPRPGGYLNGIPETYYPELVRRVMTVPNVRIASLAKFAPANTGDRVASVFAGAPNDGSLGTSVAVAQVSPGFFKTLDIPVISGREFTWTDSDRGTKVLAISLSLSKRMFGGSEASGRHLKIRYADRESSGQVVGIVGDARLNDPRNPNTLAVYVPTLQGGAAVNWNDLLVRSDGPLDQLRLRQQVGSLGREDIVEVGSLASAYARITVRERLTGILASFFGGVTLLLAAVGLFSIVSYTAIQRRREVGIRMALGAAPASILRKFLLETARIILVGMGVGAPIALISSSVLSDLLLDVGQYDVLVLTSTAASLIAVGILAAYLPARRAARIQPSDILRL
jgi:predicted permease